MQATLPAEVYVAGVGLTPVGEHWNVSLRELALEAIQAASLDMLKAFIPVLLLCLFFPDQVFHLVYSILCILGHNYPIYYRFEGGRGLSPMLEVCWRLSRED